MARPFGNCGSYFAVNGNKCCEMLSKEEALAVQDRQKKQRQALMAQQLTRLAKEEYGADIVRHMEEQELKTLPDAASIDIQTEIEWYMRPYLLDFLIEAHASFGLLPETLFLAINILDRYCSKRVVYRKHYQLVGCTALLIASKYGEPGKKVPRIKELANMCCSLYEEDMFTQMERHVMVTLDWIIGPPTVDAFLQIALDDEAFDPEVEHMARYIAEIAMFHKEYVSIRPSEMARASLALSRVILRRAQPYPNDWAAQYDSLILVSLSQTVHQPSQVLVQKYRSAHLSQVAWVLEDFLTMQAAIARNRVASSTPPTPPCERSLGSSGNAGVINQGPYQTPQKSQYPQNLPNGCLTPPITPDSECFENYNPGFAARDAPPTPTPSKVRAQSTGVYSTSYYQTASIM